MLFKDKDLTKSHCLLVNDNDIFGHDAEKVQLVG